jgi:hypothetical protein
MNTSKNVLSIGCVLLVGYLVISARPARGQQIDQRAMQNAGKGAADGEDSLEQALKELSSLSSQVREARQQYADERVAAARAIATLEAERDELKRVRAQDEMRVARLQTGLREVAGHGRTSPREVVQDIETLLKAVRELRVILVQSLAPKPGNKSPADGKNQIPARASEGRSNP